MPLYPRSSWVLRYESRFSDPILSKRRDDRPSAGPTSSAICGAPLVGPLLKSPPPIRTLPAGTPRGADHWLQLSTNEGSAPSSTYQFDLTINDMGRLRGRQRQPCKHRDIAGGFGVFQSNLCCASRTTDGYVPRQPRLTRLAG